MVVGGMLLLVRFIWGEIALESSYKHRYGPEWRSEYEHDHGSLSHAHTKMAIAGLSLLAVISIISWLYWQAQNKRRHRHRR
jgi:hypothetical protein